MTYDRIKQKLAAGHNIILDGGTGTDIQRRGAPMSRQTWCADVNATHGEIVRAVHDDYVRAGADVIAANTFATSPLTFNAYGRDDELIALDKAAVDHAKAATAGKQVCIAGSISTQRPLITGTDRTDFAKTWTKSEAMVLFRRKAENLSVLRCAVRNQVSPPQRSTTARRCTRRPRRTSRPCLESNRAFPDT